MAYFIQLRNQNINYQTLKYLFNLFYISCKLDLSVYLQHCEYYFVFLVFIKICIYYSILPFDFKGTVALNFIMKHFSRLFSGEYKILFLGNFNVFFILSQKQDS